MRHLLLLATFLFSSANAAVVDIRPTDSGWFDSTGQHISSLRNYIAGYGVAGRPPLIRREYRNFIIFDMSAVEGRIVSAELILDTHSVIGGEPEYRLSGGNLTAIDTQLDSDYAEGSSAGRSIFDSLGMGPDFGSAIATDDYQQISIELNSFGLAALNSADGLFDFNGRVVDIFPLAGTYYLFGDSQNPIRGEEPLLRLTTVPVPLPAAVWLFGSALGLLTAWRKTR